MNGANSSATSSFETRDELAPGHRSVQRGFSSGLQPRPAGFSPCRGLLQHNFAAPTVQRRARRGAAENHSRILGLFGAFCGRLNWISDFGFVMHTRTVLWLTFVAELTLFNEFVKQVQGRQLSRRGFFGGVMSRRLPPWSSSDVADEAPTP